ncbi:MAG: hypothetical protein B7Y02_16150 [Rhodobacterales bacterium 17-64-5]|nr:MAG: hypothetical protein B7Y02_16150 [Rhodobacterales bacterium 17-64-5]
MLAQSGPDSALLNHAILGEAELPPMTAKGSAALIADRLLGLGLADQAQAWLNLDPSAPALLNARVKLAQDDPQATLALLGTDESVAALTVKAQALTALGQTRDAAELYAKIGKPDDQVSALVQTGDWPAVAADGTAPWKAVASIVTTNTALTDTAKTVTGPLARNRALVKDSSATRDAIAQLLDSVKAPAVPTQ